MALSYSSPLLINLRRLARRIGLTKLLSRLRASAAYEEAFSRELLGSVRPTDCVWDVGANVGYYTRRVSELAPNGRVVAFEPGPATFKTLSDDIQARNLTNVVLCNIAL